jgi:hypothetical protein
VRDKNYLACFCFYLARDFFEKARDNFYLARDNFYLARDKKNLARDKKNLARDFLQKAGIRRAIRCKNCIFIRLLNKIRGKRGAFRRPVSKRSRRPFSDGILWGSFNKINPHIKGILPEGA